ncbi:arginine--tRNA ligase [Flavobacteriaceae bacterium]|nr:arginine--tRNA ligase [Flavobacteriaceae bacterium]MDB2625592.1 arginine--tRNA ligase [Flavobacteriaceae bacterium]
MNIQTLLEAKVKEGFLALFETTLPTVEFQATRKDFEGDITIVVFPMLRYKKGNPAQIGESLGGYLVENVKEVIACNVVKGFLNLVIDDSVYLQSFNAIYTQGNFGLSSKSKDVVMVEYSSPNTNKPLHLGHVRNNLLGYSVAEILKASGHKVYKTQIINDRGIHICKSMLAWKKFGNSETPDSTGMKGDSFVGKYYVKFNDAYKKEVSTLIANGSSEEVAKKQAPILMEAQEMLLKWEAGEVETVALWKMMNSWVYEGFKITYKNLGVDFDTLYYESNTYLLGKDVIEDGITRGVFFKKEDGSVWCDLTDEGLDEKLVLRSDGTAVYMTQDIGTAIQRVKDHSDINGMVYTVGNEQDYHFKVLFLILKKLDFSWAAQLYHLSYGMVDLPSGKMKSREGTVVDADELMLEMTDTAKNISQELGKLDGYSEEEKSDLYRIIGLGALKYFILKVDPKKRILFDPKASVDFQGNTGPFIQYTYARIQSILRKAKFDFSLEVKSISTSLHSKEKELIKQLELYPDIIQQAAKNYSPALIANYTYDLVKEFNSFYQNVSILGETNESKKIIRVQLANKVAYVIKSAFSLLGIQVPNRM